MDPGLGSQFTQYRQAEMRREAEATRLLGEARRAAHDDRVRGGWRAGLAAELRRSVLHAATAASGLVSGSRNRPHGGTHAA